MKLVLKWIASALTLLAISKFISGIQIEGFYIALITALILGLVNAVIRPLLVLLTLPITILTLGLFTFVINGVLFWFVSTFIEGFSVTGFLPAFLGALILSAVSAVLSLILEKD